MLLFCQKAYVDYDIRPRRAKRRRGPSVWHLFIKGHQDHRNGKIEQQHRFEKRSELNRKCDLSTRTKYIVGLTRTDKTWRPAYAAFKKIVWEAVPVRIRRFRRSVPPAKKWAYSNAYNMEIHKNILSLGRCSRRAMEVRPVYEIIFHGNAKRLFNYLRSHYC